MGVSLAMINVYSVEIVSIKLRRYERGDIV